MKKAQKQSGNNKKRIAILIAIIAAIVVIATVITVVVILNNKKNENPYGLSDEALSQAEAHAKIPGHGFVIGDTKWQTNADYHWYICQHKTCEDKLNYGPHEFDEGVVVSEPTADADGETKYTCKVCGRKKTVSVPFESTVDPSQDPSQRPDPDQSVEALPNWLDVIKEADFENFSFTQSVSYPYSGDISRSDNTTIRFTKDLAGVSYTYQLSNGDVGNIKDYEEFDGSDLTLKRKEISDVVLLLLADKNKFEYSTESQSWVAKESFTTKVTLAGINSDTVLSNLSVKFDNTFVSEISFEYLDGDTTKTVKWSFYHYKGTSFDPPADPWEGLE